MTVWPWPSFLMSKIPVGNIYMDGWVCGKWRHLVTDYENCVSVVNLHSQVSPFSGSCCISVLIVLQAGLPIIKLSYEYYLLYRQSQYFKWWLHCVRTRPVPADKQGWAPDTWRWNLRADRHWWPWCLHFVGKAASEPDNNVQRCHGRHAVHHRRRRPAKHRLLQQRVLRLLRISLHHGGHPTDVWKVRHR